ncbi:GNAT family N-acetyltransferase [Inquilinus limosus]|uniref:GNAT family N-acetyltransferase n=1 Tax=Inquilinus limosus TaxID=171674 RepID=UPI00041B7D2A|nr:GNAT family N-acetyltransferase [Inquilinus limosus]
MMIETAERLAKADIAHCDFSFEIDSELVAPYRDPVEHARPVEPYRKAYEFDPEEFSDIGPDRMLAVAKDAGRLRGYILVSRSWNNYASIDDFAVDRAFRGAGIGLRLMDRSVRWAREQGLPGVRLETQSNNVPACRFYKRYGFVLGGYDEYHYATIPGLRNEVALFWYLMLAKDS